MGKTTQKRCCCRFPSSHYVKCILICCEKCFICVLTICEGSNFFCIFVMQSSTKETETFHYSHRYLMGLFHHWGPWVLCTQWIAVEIIMSEWKCSAETAVHTALQPVACCSQNMTRWCRSKSTAGWALRRVHQMALCFIVSFVWWGHT